MNPPTAAGQKRRREGWREAPNGQDQAIGRLAMLIVAVIAIILFLRLRG